MNDVKYNNTVIFSIAIDHSIHFMKWADNINPDAKEAFYIIENSLLFTDEVQAGVYKSILVLEADMTSETGFSWLISDDPQIFKNLFTV